MRSQVQAGTAEWTRSQRPGTRWIGIVYHFTTSPSAGTTENREHFEKCLLQCSLAESVLS